MIINRRKRGIYEKNNSMKYLLKTSYIIIIVIDVTVGKNMCGWDENEKREKYFVIWDKKTVISG